MSETVKKSVDSSVSSELSPEKRMGKLMMLIQDIEIRGSNDMETPVIHQVREGLSTGKMTLEEAEELIRDLGKGKTDYH